MATTITANGINFPDGSASSPSIGGSDTNTGLFTGADIIGFSTGGSERLRIDSSGNVGIGTTSPAQIFHVKNTGAHTTWRIENDNADFLIQAGDAGADGLHFYDMNNSAYRMIIANSGNVGIGTTSPTGGKLHIAHGNELGLFTSGPYNFQAKFESTDAEAAIVIEDNGSTNDGNRIGVISDVMAFTTAGSERMRIDSSGRVLIGSTTADDAAQMLKVARTSGTARLAIQAANDGSSQLDFADVADADIGRIQYDHNSNYMALFTNNSEAIRIESSGAIRSGTNSVIQAEKFTWFRPETDANTLAYFHQGASANVTGIIMRHGRGLSGFSGKMLGFLRNDGTEVGSVVIGNGSTAFNTSSDYRLKENVTAISDGITRLKTLKPYRFNFKDDTTKPIVDGFFAHEVTAVPEAITGTKDQVDADNNPVYQSIDQSKLVPLLVAALQEAVARIEALETKVAALEGA